jgi:lipopolysaccharide/colanic/teichoic acid biosynthesis glycosyltransferase
MIKNLVKQLIRFLFLQITLTFLTIFYFDRYLIGDYFEGFLIISKNLQEDWLRFYDFIPQGLIKIDTYLAIFVFIFLLVLYSTKFYSYTNDLEIVVSTDFLNQYLNLFLLWSASFLSFLQIFRFTAVSRGLMVIFLLLVPLYLLLFRNSQLISNVLGRKISDEYFISFNLTDDSFIHNLKLLKERKQLQNIKNLVDINEILNQIYNTNKSSPVNLIVINNINTSFLNKDEINNLMKLNKKILLISKKPLEFELSFIFRNVVVGNKHLYYINNDIQVGSRYIIKRLLDITFSILLIGLFSPVILFLAIYMLIKVGNPIIIAQERVGLHGKVFKLYKFRTMDKEAHHLRAELQTSEGPLFKLDKDPRIIKGTEFIRKYSLDEIPQFINVLKGEMSLVGPRPLFLEDSNYFDGNYLRRLNVLPGITGLLQINARNTDDFNDWFYYDLKYIESWSTFLDIEILLKTPFKIFGKNHSGK